MTPIVRDSTKQDFEVLLRLNLESEAVLSPLTPAQLEELHRMAWYRRVACVGDEVRAFLWALVPGATYASPNYRWFSARYQDFVYIDRIVVSSAARGLGLARLLYEDLFRLTRQRGIERITCEIDTDPPNPASQRFHERLGFQEVGAQRVADGKKAVSLQLLQLDIAKT
jgi:predicted GNAT superfamily acetyltransferase